MKKICFTVFVLLALCLFFLLSCGKSDTLFDILSEAVAEDVTLSAGKIICYGRHYDKPMSEDSLSDCLGLSGYPEFAEKIEDFVLFSTINGDYAEVALIRLYKASDTREAALFFERRITDAKRALSASKKQGCAENGYVEVKGNTVALYMLPKESKTDAKIKDRI